MSILYNIGWALLALLGWVVTAGLAMWLNGRGLLTPGSLPDRVAQFFIRTIDWALAFLAVLFGVWLLTPRSRKKMGPFKQQVRVLQEARAAERKLDTNLRRAVRETRAAAAGRETTLRIDGANEVAHIEAESRLATPDEAHSAWEKRHGR